MEGQARRAAALKRLTRVSALGAALLGVVIYAGVSGLPADVQGWFAGAAQPQLTTGSGDSSEDTATAPAPPAQAPSSTGGPAQTRTGAS